MLGNNLQERIKQNDCCSTPSVSNSFSFTSLLNKNTKMALKGRSYNDIIRVQTETQVSSNALHMLQIVQQLLGSLHNNQTAFFQGNNTD
jgi:hypothetical protein